MAFRFLRIFVATTSMALALSAETVQAQDTGSRVVRPMMMALLSQDLRKTPVCPTGYV
jgi:hypothetical protein